MRSARRRRLDPSGPHTSASAPTTSSVGVRSAQARSSTWANPRSAGRRRRRSVSSTTKNGTPLAPYARARATSAYDRVGVLGRAASTGSTRSVVETGTDRDGAQHGVVGDVLGAAVKYAAQQRLLELAPGGPDRPGRARGAAAGGRRRCWRAGVLRQPEREALLGGDRRSAAAAIIRASAPRPPPYLRRRSRRP